MMTFIITAHNYYKVDQRSVKQDTYSGGVTKHLPGFEETVLEEQKKQKKLSSQLSHKITNSLKMKC